MVVDGAGRVLRVVCDYCGSQHNYRGGGAPARSSPAERRPSANPYRVLSAASPRLAGAPPSSLATSGTRPPSVAPSRVTSPDREPPPSRYGPPPAVVPEPVVFPRASPVAPAWSAPRWPAAAREERRTSPPPPASLAEAAEIAQPVVSPATTAAAWPPKHTPPQSTPPTFAPLGAGAPAGLAVTPATAMAPDLDEALVESPAVWAADLPAHDSIPATARVAAPTSASVSHEPFPLVSAREQTGVPMSTSELGADVELLLRRVIREELGLTSVVPADKWRGGEIVLRPGNPQLQEKSWPIETFFHKVVMIRNRLRTLEQQVNSSDMPEDVKVRLQTYVTGCYGSLTSFNLLFADEQDHFKGSGSGD